MGDLRNSMIGVLRCREPEKFDHTHFHYANLAYSYYISIKTEGAEWISSQTQTKKKKKTETRGDKPRQSKRDPQVSHQICCLVPILLLSPRNIDSTNWVFNIKYYVYL